MEKEETDRNRKGRDEMNGKGRQEQKGRRQEERKRKTETGREKDGYERKWGEKEQAGCGEKMDRTSTWRRKEENTEECCSDGANLM